MDPLNNYRQKLLECRRLNITTRDRLRLIDDTIRRMDVVNRWRDDWLPSWRAKFDDLYAHFLDERELAVRSLNDDDDDAI